MLDKLKCFECADNLKVSFIVSTLKNDFKNLKFLVKIVHEVENMCDLRYF